MTHSPGNQWSYRPWPASKYGAGVAGKIGVAKPNSEPFMRALDQLGVAPEQALFIGDNLTRDITPALNLGMAALLISRHAEDHASITLPDGRCDVIPSLHAVQQFWET